MNKKLIPFAVAAALTAPLAAQAEVTIYGKANVSYDAVKCDGDKYHYKITSNQPEGCGAFIFDENGELITSSFYGPEGRASRLGFKGSEDLGNGLKAIWKMEFSVDMANNSAVNSSRNAYAGLAGDTWGTILMGRHDSPYKMATSKLDYFSDQLADFNGTIGFEDLRLENVAAYISPNWGGFTLSGAIVAPGFLGGDVGRDAAEAYSIAGVYDNGPFFVSAAYENFDKQWASIESSPFVLGSGPAKDKWKVGAGWQGDAFGINGVYEDRSKQGNQSNSDVKNWNIQGKYMFGNNTIKAMGGNSDPDWESSYTSWGIGWDYNFTRRTQLWANYADSDDHWKGYSLGVTHKF